MKLLKEYGQELADWIIESRVGLVGLVDFGDFTDPKYKNYAWRHLKSRSESAGDAVEEWEAAFILFAITKCVQTDYATDDEDSDGRVWKAIAQALESVKAAREQRSSARLTVNEQSRIGRLYRASLENFGFPLPDQFQLKYSQANIGPMLFHAGFAGATVQPVVRMIRRAQSALGGFQYASDSDVRRQWLRTSLGSQAIIALHNWPRRMLASYVPAVDDLWETLVALVRLHDQDAQTWTLQDLEDLAIPGVDQEQLLSVLLEGHSSYAREAAAETESVRGVTRARLYFGHLDEPPCPRLHVDSDVEAPAVQQKVGDNWVPCDCHWLKTRLGSFADFDTALTGSALRLLDGEVELRRWHLFSDRFPAIVFAQQGGALVDAKKVEGAGIFSGERLLIFKGAPRFTNLDPEECQQIDLLWSYYDRKSPWTAWLLRIPHEHHELTYELDGNDRSIVVARDRHLPLRLDSAPVVGMSAVSQDATVMPVYADHPVVRQDGGRALSVVCDLERANFYLERKNRQRRLRTQDGLPLTTGAGAFQIRRLKYPQLEVARYAVVPGLQFQILESDLTKPVRIELRCEDGAGEYQTLSDNSKLSLEDGRVILTAPRDQPFQNLMWQPADDGTGQAAAPVKLQIAIPGVRWRVIRREDGTRETQSYWTNERIAIARQTADRQLLELEVQVPSGWRLHVNEGTKGTKPRQTVTGDIYRLRLAGQERPTFVTPDGITHRPALIASRPIITGVDFAPLADGRWEVVGRGHFLQGVTVQAWPTGVADANPQEVAVSSDDNSFVFEWPGGTNHSRAPNSECFSFLVGKAESDGLFEDAVEYALEETGEGLRPHGGWLLPPVDEQDPNLLWLRHQRQAAGLASGSAGSNENWDIRLLSSALGNGAVNHHALAEFDSDDSAIPWRYLHDLDRLKHCLEKRARQEAARSIYTFHEQQRLASPHRVMPLFSEDILGRSVSRVIPGWRGQRDYSAQPSSDVDFAWEQSLGLLSVEFRSKTNGSRVKWHPLERLFRGSDDWSLTFNGKISFEAVRDEVLPGFAHNLKIGDTIWQRLNVNSDATRPGEDRELEQSFSCELHRDCLPLHKKVQSQISAAAKAHQSSTSQDARLVWTVSWAVAQCLTSGSSKYSDLMASRASVLARFLVQQRDAFRVAIALASLVQTLIYDGGLGEVAVYHWKEQPTKPR